MAGPVRVVGLGAICDLREGSRDGRSQSFSVSEFALLDDGRRVVLHSERGFTIGWGSSVRDAGDISTGMTADSIAHDVLSVVLPDDDCGDDHPWSWLAELARSRGLDVTAPDLQGLPYEVTLRDRVRSWLPSA